MDYYLGKYRYHNGRVQKKSFLWFYKNVDDKSYSYMEAVRRINGLCGIVEVQKPGEVHRGWYTRESEQ
jgi:hypothetical protein